MSKRLLILTCAAALVSAACSNLPQADVSFGSGKEFVPYVADSLDDAGLGNAIALDKDGVPYVSYFVFPAKLAAGDIPIPRPIGTPFIATGGENSKDGAAVGVASVSAEGVWTRGAAAQVIDSPAGIVVPYDPDTVDSLVGATADNTNGTDIAIDANGGKHVVWAGRDGIWYATGTTSFKGSATAIEKWTPPLARSGPLGRPSVTVDAAAQPWVAYAIDTAKGQAIRVATTDGAGWTTETAATLAGCFSSCRRSGPAPIAVNAGGALVVYVDGAAGAVMAARQSGNIWTTETVQANISPSGLSVAVDANGTPWVVYYTGDGAVNLATTAGTGWTTSNVADAKPGNGTGNLAETTGVAVGDDGTVYVAWYDDAQKGVQLASGAQGGGFKSIDTTGTEGGGFPSLAVTPDGSRVFLAWYDLETKNLLVGVLGTVTDILIAQPSPTPEALSATSPPPAVSCPKGGLELAAPTGAAESGFAETTLTAPANKDFTICFSNQDSGVPHNVEVLTEQNGTSIAKGNIITGPAQELLTVPGQPPGTYFYQCDVHQTTMTGTITIK